MITYANQFIIMDINRCGGGYHGYLLISQVSLHLAYVSLTMNHLHRLHFLCHQVLNMIYFSISFLHFWVNFCMQYSLSSISSTSPKMDIFMANSTLCAKYHVQKKNFNQPLHSSCSNILAEVTSLPIPINCLQASQGLFQKYQALSKLFACKQCFQTRPSYCEKSHSCITFFCHILSHQNSA